MVDRSGEVERAIYFAEKKDKEMLKRNELNEQGRLRKRSMWIIFGVLLLL